MNMLHPVKQNEAQCYDIVIPVNRKNVKFVRHVIKYIRLNLLEGEIIYIITQETLFSKLKSIDDKCILIDENRMVPGLCYDSVRQYMVEAGCLDINRVGWYFQQLLKLGFALTSYCRGYYLTWDSDTLPLSRLCFFQDGKPLFTSKKEFHQAYFNTMYRLIGVGKLAPYSFIAEHMMFRRDIVQELIRTITGSESGKSNWVENIIKACDFSESVHCFSEFETYGTFCMLRYPDLYGTQYLNTFRSAGLIRGRYINDFIIERLAVDLDIASFEIYDAIFPYDLEKRIHNLKSKIKRLKTTPLKEIIKIARNKIAKC